MRKPDDERVLLRLEVDVAGPVLGGLEDDRVDEPDERDVGDAVVDLEVVGSSVLGLLDERRPLRRSRRGRRRPPRRGRAGGSRSRCPRARRRRARAGSASRAAARRSRARCRDRRSRRAACSPSSAYGSARSRARARGAASRAARLLVDAGQRRGRRTAAGSGWRACARRPRSEATPSSSERLRERAALLARGRGRPRGGRRETSPVASIRSATSSATSLTAEAAGSRRRPRRRASSAPDLPDSLRLLGRLRSIESLERGIGRTRLEKLSARSGSGTRRAAHRPANRAISAPSARNGANGMPILRAAEPWRARRTTLGHERGEHAEHQADADEPAEHRAEQQRELDVAHAHPGRVGERGHEQEAGGAERAERPLRARVRAPSARRARSPPPGTTIRFGTIRCSRSIAVSTTSTTQKNDGHERPRRVRPNVDEAAGDERGGRQLDERVERR